MVAIVVIKLNKMMDLLFTKKAKRYSRMNSKQDIEDIKKEIEFLSFDISMDEMLEGSSDFSLVSARLDDNRKKLKELEELINE